ncbi:ComEA family DNA-binding protein [Mucilaginibacter glaciei]|uniref:Helix-hairpin-helix domain-containing protein n=1 Tax=Mucilaginibacter glaciei TaxID=2772109 RepID=A0A926NT77_9SPHI|nr:helix-hairpin-helix domain-containing protein [Mucilaginibacter glaciei]MBD1394863.1 helix-hairpin-helix domain-containing protein [Mucilaginibacter glaciei]
MKTHVKNYLSLTKRDWNGITVLLVLIAVALAAPFVYQWFTKDNTINPNEFNLAIAQLNKSNPAFTSKDSKTSANVAPFKFDPNTITASQWQQLGLTAGQANTIINYRSKGGKFYKDDDLKKIYGITPVDYKRLAPYISVNSETIKPKIMVELNSSDSSKLTSVEGIGPAFAMRIINYRERLGGFIAKEQLKEVFGVNELKYKEIAPQVRVNVRRIRKIAINTITFDKLRLMPYLNYKQVNALIEYRKQHGDYQSMDDLRNIAIIDEQILRKIEPYIIFE